MDFQDERDCWYQQSLFFTWLVEKTPNYGALPKMYWPARAAQGLLREHEFKAPYCGLVHLAAAAGSESLVPVSTVSRSMTLSTRASGQEAPEVIITRKGLFAGR